MTPGYDGRGSWERMRERQTFEHTADVGIEAWGASLGELMEALGEALADFICPVRSVSPRSVRPVEVQAEDVEALAVDWLGALLNLVQVDRFMVSSIRLRGADENCLAGEIEGEEFAPDRHEIAHEVKAVTYHQLKIERSSGRWHGRVILDI
jgi:SHS2 domain-containing protein